MGRLGIGLTAALLIAGVAAPALATPPTDPDVVGDGHKVKICHATSSSHLVQYWEIITVDIASSGGWNKFQGHLEHIENDKKLGRTDVIPEFKYGTETFGPYGDSGNLTQWDEWLDATDDEGLACLGQVGG